MQGKFLDNGGCGYVLRPDYMFVDGYLPGDPDCLARLGVQPLDLQIRLIGARHLMGPRSRRGLISPFVELEVVGADYDHVRLRHIERYYSCI
jgi:phosphatidylinositol phospholipase C gamma-1